MYLTWLTTKCSVKPRNLFLEDEKANDCKLAEVEMWCVWSALVDWLFSACHSNLGPTLIALRASSTSTDPVHGTHSRPGMG